MKNRLFIFILIIGFSASSAAQRGRNKQGKEPYPLNSFCCIFINDSKLTTDARDRYWNDVEQLAIEVCESFGVAYLHDKNIEAVQISIYHSLIMTLLLEDKTPELHLLQYIDFHVDNIQDTYQTDIQAVRLKGGWEFLLNFRFQNDISNEWMIYEWSVIVDDCHESYTILAPKNYSISEYILRQAQANKQGDLR